MKGRNNVDDLIKKIQDAVTQAVQSQAAEFLSQNLGARQFLKDRAERMAKLGADYVVASEEERKTILLDFEVVRQSTLNEITAVTLLATAETRSAFKSALMAAIDMLLKVLPGIVSALA